MYSPRLIVYLLTLFCFAVQSFAQNAHISFNHLEPEQVGAKRIGYPTFDNKGNMWFTSDFGFGMYNGYSAKKYVYKEGSKNSVLSKNIGSFFYAKDGKIWIGYQDNPSLTCFDPKTELFKHYNNDNKTKGYLPELMVVKFVEDESGALYVLCWGEGLLKLDQKTGAILKQFKRKSKEDTLGIGCNQVKSMVKFPDGRYLLSFFAGGDKAYSSGLCFFDPVTEKFTPFDVNEYARNSTNMADANSAQNAMRISHFLYLGENEKLWIGTYSCLICVDLKNKTTKRISAGAFNAATGNLDNARNYVVDDDGYLWVGTATSGIMLVDTKTEKAVYIKNNALNESSIPVNMIGLMSKDTDGNIWVSNSSGAISIYSPLKQQFKITYWDNLPIVLSERSSQDVPLNDLILDANGIAYVTSANGLCVFDPAAGHIVDTVKPKIKVIIDGKPFTVNSLHGMRFYKGELLISSDHTLWKYDGRAHSLKQKYTVGPGIAILFKQDSLAPLFIRGSLYHQLFLYNEATNKLDTFMQTLAITQREFNNPCFRLKNGKFFVQSSLQGFLIVDPIKKTHERYFKDKDKTRLFPDSTITHSYYDNKDKVYICTANGVYIYDINTEAISKHEQLSILADEPVMNLIEDDFGFFWVALRNKLIRWHPKDNTHFIFTKKHGLNVGFFTRQPIYKDALGKIYFRTLKGLLMIDPSKIKIPSSKPLLYLSGLTIKDSLISQQELEKFEAGPTELKYNMNFISFEFSTNQPFVIQPNIFRYRLLGLDTSWSDNGISNRIKYTNLSPGNYTLQVKCLNGYNVSSDIKNIPFKILSPFWFSWWFITLCVALLFAVLFAIQNTREKVLRKSKELLEQKVVERTKEVSEKAEMIESQKHVIEEKNKELTDSIHYAQRIQQALLASKTILDNNLKQGGDYFVYFNPKDIVSGDFYWAAEAHGKFYLIVADSTGHGVPGAFMSLLNISFLNEAINEKNIDKPDLILNYVRSRLVQSFTSSNGLAGGNDGMDCSLLCFNRKDNLLEFACANNAVVIMRNNEMMVQPYDRMPVGRSPKQNIPFTFHSVKLNKGDMVYAYTDGYYDQFGGEKGKKFKNKKLLELIATLTSKTAEEQHEKLSSAFIQWRGSLEQIDDVLVTGIRI